MTSKFPFCLILSRTFDFGFPVLHTHAAGNRALCCAAVRPACVVEREAERASKGGRERGREEARNHFRQEWPDGTTQQEVLAKGNTQPASE